MRQIFFICLLSCMWCSVKSQVTSDISYDATRKVLTWTLTNHFDKKVILKPNSFEDVNTTEGCWYRPTYKDADNKDVFVYANCVSGTFLSPKSSRSFKIYLSSSVNGAKSVEIFFHVGVRIMDGDNRINWTGKEFTVSYDL